MRTTEARTSTTKRRGPYKRATDPGANNRTLKTGNNKTGARFLETPSSARPARESVNRDVQKLRRLGKTTKAETARKLKGRKR
jgi:hypothetical protein